MSEEDIDVLGPDGQGSAARVDRDRRAPRFSWTPAYEATFFRSLCDSVQLGLRENSSFKAEAWERAAAALQESHSALPTKSHLINKSDNARKRFRLWRGLREDPDFAYNSTTKTVTATEDAWAAHIEREPLSRALRGRPFDHEEFMEILYPDVIGSGGAPKRIMKPRRRTDGQPGDDSEMPGTGTFTLSNSNDAASVSQSDINSPEQSRPSLSQTPSGSSSGSVTVPQRPTSTAIPPRTAAGARSSSVLTPPDETVPLPASVTVSTGTPSAQNRKRPLKADDLTPASSEYPMSTGKTLVDSGPVSQHTSSSPDKRRKTIESPASIPQPQQQQPLLTSTPTRPPPRPLPTPAAGASSSSYSPHPSSKTNPSSSFAIPLAASPPPSTTPALHSPTTAAALDTASLGNRLLVELLEAVRARGSGPKWREEALDLFFRDFSQEELDLQVKISENVLSNENKAMVFCKMPLRVRQHWVKRFREMHHKAA